MEKVQEVTYWKRCSTCKKEIGFRAPHYVCSVSTCRHPRKGFRFCSVECWDAHLGFANHREAWAEDAVAPTKEEYLQSEEGYIPAERAPKRVIVAPETASPHTRLAHETPSASVQTDTLIVVSKVKALIKERSGMSTSQCCIDALTKKVVGECLKAIEYATNSGRKTVMGRDVK
jgi:hypothetical protein